MNGRRGYFEWSSWIRQSWRMRVVAKYLFMVAGLIHCPSLIGATKLSGDLVGLPPKGVVDVIIQFTHTPTNNDLAPLVQMGGGLKRTFPNIQGILITMPVSALQAVAARPGIVWISLDRKVAGSLEFAEPTVNANIALQHGWNGSAIGVAVIDSGIYNHPDLNPRVVYAESFVAGDLSTADAFGHGTHVAGLVGGNGLESTGNSYNYTFRGIAPNANIINLRALDANGQGTDSAVIAAMDRAIALKNTYAIRVVNLSLGRTIQESY